MSEKDTDIAAMAAALRALNRINDPDARVAALDWVVARVEADAGRQRAVADNPNVPNDRRSLARTIADE